MSSEVRRIYSKVKASFLSKLTNDVINVEGDWEAGVSKDEINSDNLRHAIEILNMKSHIKHTEADVYSNGNVTCESLRVMFLSPKTSRVARLRINKLVKIRIDI